MSRQSNIKWRIQDERELAQVARDFNRKLDRLVQDNPKLAYIYPKFYNDKTKQLECRHQRTQQRNRTQNTKQTKTGHQDLYKQKQQTKHRYNNDPWEHVSTSFLYCTQKGTFFSL